MTPQPYPPAPRFPAMLQPSSNFQAVRDGRSTGPLYLDIDLATARSAAAGTALELNIAGNVIYFDQLPGSGVATLYFENDDRGMVPITVFAGWKGRVPFTRLFIENTAQTGTRLRLIYGVDIDLDPGTGAGVSVLNPINVQDQIATNARHTYLSVPAVAVGNANTVLLPGGGTPPTSYRVRGIYLSGAAGVGGVLTIGLVAFPSGAWPGTFASSANTIFLGVLTNYGTTVEQLFIPLNRQTPPSWRIAAFYSAAVAVGSAEFGLETEEI